MKTEIFMSGMEAIMETQYIQQIINLANTKYKNNQTATH